MRPFPVNIGNHQPRPEATPERPVIRLSLGTWVKIVCFVIAHTFAIVVMAWQYSLRNESRLTALETNYRQVASSLDRLDGSIGRLIESRSKGRAE